MNQTVHTLLKELGADTIPHGDGTLYDHLARVEKILETARCDQVVCTAGLIHSIYGTEFFKTVTATDRDSIQKAVGERSEFLAWVFCNANRPFCWFTGNNIALRNGQSIRVDDRTLHDLQMIESANLIDQHQGAEFTVSFSSKNNFLD
jgi:hypothetical protein